MVDRLILKIKSRRYAIAYTTQVLVGTRWIEVIGKKTIGKNAKTVTVDLSHVEEVVSGVRLVGASGLCRLGQSLSLVGFEVAPYDHAILDCPLVVVPLAGQCVNEYAHIRSIVTYEEEEEEEDTDEENSSLI